VPRVSVVVPIYQVERYLAACLQSLARQTFSDLEVLLVDDGSTDHSVHIAEHFSERDARFRLFRQSNGGLSRARNTGIANAGGEFIAFVDSDDIVPDGAYARLVRTLESTGSDFATGNIQRLTHRGTQQSRFVAKTFARTRMRTHVTRFRPLLADRTAWNKLWRREFWERHAGRFPEGVVHEDIPVVLPAHLAARSVDVLAAAVYHWRRREGGSESITQRRLEYRVLSERLAAVEQVRSHFAEHSSKRLCKWYDASLLADDLRRHLLLLDQADARYRTLFMEGARRVLATATPDMLAPLRAIDRLKWYLIGRGLEEELLEVIRFEREKRDQTPPLRRFGRFYGDYPYRTDRRLAIPRSIYRLRKGDQELTLKTTLDGLDAVGEQLRIRGTAYLPGVAAASPRSLRTTALALSPGRWQAARIRLVATRLPTVPVLRPMLQPSDARSLDQSWAGFEASVDLARLWKRGGWRAGRWRVFLSTRAGPLRRRRGVFEVDDTLIGAHDLAAPEGVRAQAIVSAGGGLTVHVVTRWARLDTLNDVDGEVEIWVRMYARAGPAPALRLVRRTDGLALTYQLHARAPEDEARLVARVPVRDLFGVPPSLELSARGEGDELWDVWVEGAGDPLPLALRDEEAGASGGTGCESLTLVRTSRGQAALGTHHARSPEAAGAGRTVGDFALLERTTSPASLGRRAAA
jgi:CDP-glycerol glycerophosphotransferase